MPTTSEACVSRTLESTVPDRRGLGHTPLDRERTFGPEQIIVSKTDLKGVITYANDVFSSVSGCPRAELQGRAHHIVRHPDFPGGVFELLWRSVEEGREFLAYLKNLARDGSYYWVLAHVSPILDARNATIGYHSSQRVPEAAAIEELAPLYAQMMALESEQTNPHRAAQTSAQFLEDELAARGHSYDSYLWDLISRTGGG